MESRRARSSWRGTHGGWLCNACGRTAGSVWSFARSCRHLSPSETIDALVRLPLDGDVILHPDVYGMDDAVAALGSRAVFETWMSASNLGRRSTTLVPSWSSFPKRGFVSTWRASG